MTCSPAASHVTPYQPSPAHGSPLPHCALYSHSSLMVHSTLMVPLPQIGVEL